LSRFEIKSSAVGGIMQLCYWRDILSHKGCGGWSLSALCGVENPSGRC